MRLPVLALLASCSFHSEAPGTSIDAPPPDMTEPMPACLQARCRMKVITVDHTKVVGGPHASFPLYVQIADPDFANAVGTDFAFVTADAPTQILAYERERFAGTELTAWVGIPTLSSTADTVLYLYYGDVSAPDTQNRAAVWDSDFQAVWHLGETTGGTNAIKDSTSHAVSGTDLGGVGLGVAAKLGAGMRFDGNDDHLRVPSSPAFTPVYTTATLSVWVNWNDATTGDFQRIVLATNSLEGNGRGFEWGTNPTGQYYYYPSDAGGTTNFAAIPSPFTNSTWHHVAITQEFSTKTLAMFVDGMPRALATVPAMWNQVMTAADWHFGGTMNRTKFAGMLDEIHISKVVRSPGWIATEYANQNAPAAFYR